MSLRPACAGTQTGTPQRMKTPPIPQPWGEQHTPRIGGRGAIFKGGSVHSERTLPVTAAILAGGNSRRMGHNKALLPLSGQPLIAHVAARLEKVARQRIILSNDAATYQFLDLPIYGDIFVGVGALAGVHAALTYAAFPLVFVVACDMPFLDPRLLRWLYDRIEEADVVMPRLGGREEPLHALYRRHRVLPKVTARLQAGYRRVVSFLPDVNVRYVDEAEMKLVAPELRSFRNANTPEEWQRVLSEWEENSM